MYLREATMTLKKNAIIVTSQNHAEISGGAIFFEDKIDPFQCNLNLFSSEIPTTNLLFNTPDCLLQLENFKFSKTNASQYAIISHHDSAGSYGQFMYGGLLDRCFKLDIIDEHTTKYGLLYSILFSYNILKIQTNLIDERLTISSMAYSICTCRKDGTCDQPKINITVIRGQRFAVSVVAVAQGGMTRDAKIAAKVRETARLELDQYSQPITPRCTTLYYNMYSSNNNDSETLHLYPEAPCQDTGQALVLVSVNFLPCPSCLHKVR